MHNAAIDEIDLDRGDEARAKHAHSVQKANHKNRDQQEASWHLLKLNSAHVPNTQELQPSAPRLVKAGELVVLDVHATNSVALALEFLRQVPGDEAAHPTDQGSLHPLFPLASSLGNSKNSR